MPTQGQNNSNLLPMYRTSRTLCHKNTSVTQLGNTDTHPLEQISDLSFRTAAYIHEQQQNSLLAAFLHVSQATRLQNSFIKRAARPTRLQLHQISNITLTLLTHSTEHRFHSWNHSLRPSPLHKSKPGQTRSGQAPCRPGKEDFPQRERLQNEGGIYRAEHTGPRCNLCSWRPSIQHLINTARKETGTPSALAGRGGGVITLIN